MPSSHSAKHRIKQQLLGFLRTGFVKKRVLRFIENADYVLLKRADYQRLVAAAQPAVPAIPAAVPAPVVEAQPALAEAVADAVPPTPDDTPAEESRDRDPGVAPALPDDGDFLAFAAQHPGLDASGDGQPYALFRIARHLSSARVPGAFVTCGEGATDTLAQLAAMLMFLRRPERSLVLIDVSVTPSHWADDALGPWGADVDPMSNAAPSASCRRVPRALPGALRATGYPPHLLSARIYPHDPIDVCSDIAFLELQPHTYHANRAAIRTLVSRLAPGAAVLVGTSDGAPTVVSEIFERLERRCDLLRLPDGSHVGELAAEGLRPPAALECEQDPGAAEALRRHLRAESRATLSIPATSSPVTVLALESPLPAGRPARGYLVANLHAAADTAAAFLVRREGDVLPLAEFRAELRAGQRVFVGGEFAIPASEAASRLTVQASCGGPAPVTVNGPLRPQEKAFLQPVVLIVRADGPVRSIDDFPGDDLSEDYARRSGIVHVLSADDPAYGARTEVALPPPGDPRTGVFLAFGQSQAANTGQTRRKTERPVFNLNPFDMRCYVAADPLLGASNDGGSIWIEAGEKLIEEGVFDRVVFVPIAVGGAFLHEWMPGGEHHRRLQLTLGRLSLRGVRPTALLWQHGEAEAHFYPGFGSGLYEQGFKLIAASVRDRGFDMPLFVSRSTTCRGPVAPNAEAIRAAQLRLPEVVPGVLAGPDTDTIGPADRFDGCHFATAGQAKAGRLWAEVLRRGLRSRS